MKKFLIIILVFLLCSCEKAVPNFENKIDLLTYKVDMSSYRKMTSFNHQFVGTSVYELKKCIKEKGSGIFYLGSSICDYCNQLIPYMEKAAEDLNVKIYYIDSDSDKYPLLKEELDFLKEFLYRDLLKDNDTGEKVLRTPHVFTVVNGELYKSQVVVKDWESHNPSEKQIDKIYKIYYQMFEIFKDY